MRNVKTIAAATASAALVLFGGLAAVQQQAPPKLDADSLATQLGLSSKEKAQIAPQIDQLNTLLARREKMRQEHQRLWTQLHDVQQKIAGTLTPEQQRGFMMALGRAYGAQGYGWGMRGARGGFMGPGRGPMGYGMGRGRMMYGHGGGWMMGPGYGMGGGAAMMRGWYPGGTAGQQGPGGQ